MIHRASRVADQIRLVLSDAIRDEIRDPRVGFATLTEVDLSPDLKQARVFVSRLGSHAEREATVDALNHAAPFLRRRLAERARLRYTPALRFVTDDTLERGSRVEAIIRDLHAEEPPEPEGGS